MKKASSLEKKPKRSELTDDERIRDFQRKLYRKAKEEKDYRFYVLYDKVCLKYVLREAYRRVEVNKGSPGVDGVTFAKLKKKGVEKFIAGIQKEMLEMNYKPQAGKRVLIPKANGKMRPLGIPTIKDRVVQMACKMIIEPIFEADFQECSYGFRPKRSAQQAIKEIKRNLETGRTQIYDADLSSYFDTIPHPKLMTLIGKRISDEHMLHLIKMWLKAPVNEAGKISGGKKQKVGTPQGGVISPLCANIYLNPVDNLINKMQGIKEDIKIIRYADDFLLLGKEISERILHKLSEVLKRMELQINEEKTKVVNAEEETFDFLGFTFQKRWSKYEKGKKYYHTQPSMKSQKKIRANVKEYLKSNLQRSKLTVIKDLNSKLKGWLNYFNIPGNSFMYRVANNLKGYLRESLYRFHRRKSQRYNEHYSQNAYHVWVKNYGFIDPVEYCKKTTPKASEERCRKAVCGKTARTV